DAAPERGRSRRQRPRGLLPPRARREPQCRSRWRSAAAYRGGSAGYGNVGRAWIVRRGEPSWFPPAVLQRPVPITARLRLLLPELEELAILPSPPDFRCPLAHHILILTRLQHLAGDLCAENHVEAQAARLAIVVNETVAACHPFQEVLV